MEINWTTVLTVLITSLATVLPGLYAWTRQRKKDRAETARLRAETADKVIATSKQQVDISLSLIEPLKKRADNLELRVGDLEKEVEGLKEHNVHLQNVCSQLFDGCTRLSHQIRSMSGEPVFKLSRDVYTQTPNEEPKS